ncbi:tRNA (adenosine(37)-N6)-dimethylallyltransferase MiaA, partial [bacterium]|nr:tRNA (adenosine(37)-N6)-dimethylallyltransferase MiaA [bacterium]
MILNKIIIICGSTAVGKTSVSIELAKRLNGEIVCADSQQVYREMDVGTAKANLKERSQIKHHLLDVISPCEHFDVSRFCEEADCAIRKISDQNKLPIVVGGTGMYIRILCHGLCEAPPQDEEYRKELLDRINSEGAASLHDELKEKDPEV